MVVLYRRTEICYIFMDELTWKEAKTNEYTETEHYIVMPYSYSSKEFEKRYTYLGSDLGVTRTKEETFFRLWAPTADAVFVNLYQSGTAGTDDLIRSIPMKQDIQGTWILGVDEDLQGIYYTYLVRVDGKCVEACDPYARTTGVNGKRAMILDLKSTDPAGWEQDRDPNAGISVTDAVIAELHIRDLSMDPSANIRHAGKYLGLTETGTKTNSGIPTGIDHYKNLGITHLHILPMYDYGSVDESRLDKPQYNWGYDPVNFNVPEGSYSTDPYHGEVRVRELKQMVKALHDDGISVVMDVVYNHVYNGDAFCFNQIVPKYFSRTNRNGKFSNGSACGNDTASERSMVRKYLVDSVSYWADEYHIDGFRFDLVGLIDTTTINAIMDEVHRKHPNVIFYGEGWTMDTALTKPNISLCTQMNSAQVPGFAFFSDTIRDVLRGSVFDMTVPGFVAGAPTDKNTLHSCYMGVPFWANNPTQSINYVSCHDNNTLIDRITLSVPDASMETKVRMNHLAAAFCITAQGIPFFQAGEEMLRSKPDGKGGLDHNSYKSPDCVNSIKWDLLDDPVYRKTYRYYQGLLKFRKAHPTLRITSREEVLETVTPLPCRHDKIVAFGFGKNEDHDMIAIFNGGEQKRTLYLPEGNWGICIDADHAGTEVLSVVSGQVTIEGISPLIMVRIL